MKVIVPTHHSRAIARIGDALARFTTAEVARPETVRKDSAHHWQIKGEADANLVVLLVNGLHDHFLAQAERCLSRGQRYAVVQIALRTTRHPSTNQWRHLWRRASCVWSYYPLDKWIAEDGGSPVDFNFYHAPLGVDSKVFTDSPTVSRNITICTSGFRRTQESVMECDEAVVSIGGQIFQLGPEFSMKSRTIFKSGISDLDLAEMYRQCEFVSGLRRQEGFELPAAEGLLCGARPVLFDRPHYRCWYEDVAEFIPEDDGSIISNLIKLFKKKATPVTTQERTTALLRFNWERIVSGFWEAVQ
jgi:hypothetical protein